MHFPFDSLTGSEENHFYIRKWWSYICFCTVSSTVVIVYNVIIYWKWILYHALFTSCLIIDYRTYLVHTLLYPILYIVPKTNLKDVATTATMGVQILMTDGKTRLLLWAAAQMHSGFSDHTDFIMALRSSNWCHQYHCSSREWWWVLPVPVWFLVNRWTLGNAGRGHSSAQGGLSGSRNSPAAYLQPIRRFKNLSWPGSPQTCILTCPGKCHWTKAHSFLLMSVVWDRLTLHTSELWHVMPLGDEKVPS